MPSFPTHLYDLAPELLDEIFKNMDISTLEAVRMTSKYLRERVINFKLKNKELMEEKIMRARAYVDTDESELEDIFYPDEDYDRVRSYHDDDDVFEYQDLIDRLSFGSHYDEELEEFLNELDQPNGGDWI